MEKFFPFPYQFGVSLSKHWSNCLQELLKIWLLRFLLETYVGSVTLFYAARTCYLICLHGV